MKSTNAVAPADGWRSDAIRKITLRRRGASASADVLTVLEAELELLQDENAYLKTERQRVPDSTRVAEELRARLEAVGEYDSSADDAWHVLTEVLVIREGLLEICQQLVLAMEAVEGRLRAIEPEERLGLRARAEPDTAANGKFLDAELLEKAELPAAELKLKTELPLKGLGK